jgi:hypothetical protein
MKDKTRKKETRMKRSFLILFPCILLFVMAGVNEALGEDPVYFADTNLKAAVEAALGITDPTPTDMLGLTYLNAGGKAIVELTGEYATNLTYLNLGYNQISDISALTSLTGLTNLQLQVNQISNISPLSGLTSLTYLSLHGPNQISDISVLANLT